jgi:hypothetical protein
VRNKTIPQYLFIASAVLFGLCAVLQFIAGSVALGIVFALISLAGLALFVLIRSGRISW